MKRVSLYGATPLCRRVAYNAKEGEYWLESCNWETYLESKGITSTIIDSTKKGSSPHEKDAEYATIVELKVPTYFF